MLWVSKVMQGIPMDFTPSSRSSTTYFGRQFALEMEIPQISPSMQRTFWST
jgi:hypothetical protein